MTFISHPKQVELTENEKWRRRVIGLDESLHPLLPTLARWGEWFIRRAYNDRRDKGTWLVIQGLPGCGKTHVARRCDRFLKDWAFDAWQGAWRARRGIPVTVYRDWPSLAELKDEAEFDNLIQDVLEADIVILDDVGSETDRFKSGAPASRLRRVLSALEKRWLLLTTNLPKALLFEMYDSRVRDRLDMAHWFDGNGIPSHRSRLKGKVLPHDPLGSAGARGN